MTMTSAICGARDEAVEVAADAERWVSLREAARIIGRDDSTVLTYVKRGVIEQRNAPRNQASLSRPPCRAPPENGGRDAAGSGSTAGRF